MMQKKEEAFAAHRRGDLVSAEQLYNELLSLSPLDAELMHYMGVLCHQTGRAAESAAWLRKTLTHAPNAVPTWQLLIRVCDETCDVAGALNALDRYLALQPRDTGMLNFKGQLLIRLGRVSDAEQPFRTAAELSGTPAMFHDLGLCRQLLGHLASAASAYQEAIRRGHNHPNTRLWLAQCLRATGQIKEYYEVATDTAHSDAANIDLLFEAQSARRYVCDWDGFDEHQPRLLANLQHILDTNDRHDIPPGTLNYLEVDEAIISAIAKRYAGQIAAAGAALRQNLSTQTRRDNRSKIRLGYLSTDFFAHAVGSLIRDLFACHDREKFEVYGYSLRHQPDAVQSRIQQGCDTYRNLSSQNAEQIARIIQQDSIDILIDLAGYTSASQPVALAARPAPIQISWLGYLGTSGSDYIDYIIADNIVLPPELACYYTERIIRLPHFLVTSPLPIAEQRLSRKEAGLDENGFVFCSFNQPYKLDRPTFNAWMEILRRVPDSQLWLFAPDSEICGQNLHREAKRLSVDPERIVFAPRVSMAEHMARIALADLALDPFHISGGATSVATLYASVPVLTLRGNSFLARMGSSINVYLGMHELDCNEPEQYIAKAVELATTSTKLNAIKTRFKIAQQESDFFNTKVCARKLESALSIIWQRYAEGLPPADIHVQAHTDGNFSTVPADKPG